jgi:formylglycine-generating enzyme required for sulfatase activity
MPQATGWRGFFSGIRRIAHELAGKAIRGGSVGVDSPAAGSEPGAPHVIIRKPGDSTLIGGQPYVWIPPGKFLMGAGDSDREAYGDERPQHEVTITKGFWLGKTPVTQKAFEEVMERNPSHFWGRRRPVENVSWFDAQEYAGKIGAGLPTEAEWEYAARAGTTGARYGELEVIGWHGRNSGRFTHEVARKAANAWGLHDMLGNVWEWVADYYGPYSAESAVDPVGPETGIARAVRGSSCSDFPAYTRASVRMKYGAGAQKSTVGFRCRAE